jgi:hypothetical protein
METEKNNANMSMFPMVSVSKVTLSIPMVSPRGNSTQIPIHCNLGLGLRPGLARKIKMSVRLCGKKQNSSNNILYNIYIDRKKDR